MSTRKAEVVNPADGTRLSYEIEGGGPAIVWLHGSALSRVPWRGLGYLKAFPGYTHVRPDARGHGRSDKPHDVEAYTPELMVSDVLAVLDAEGIESAIVVGYSMGARVAWQLVEHHPERVIAFAALGGSHRAQQAQEIEHIFYPGYLDDLERGDIDAFVKGFGPGLDTNTAAAFRRNDPLALAAWFRATYTYDTGMPDLAVRKVPQPALLVAGTRDQQRYKDSLDAVRLLPHGRFVGLPDATHAATLASSQRILKDLVPFVLGLAASTSPR
ncbi:MAG: alpha/beta fold hydrolase [Galactobacter sp.]